MGATEYTMRMTARVACPGVDTPEAVNLFQVPALTLQGQTSRTGQSARLGSGAMESGDYNCTRQPGLGERQTLIT